MLLGKTINCVLVIAIAWALPGAHSARAEGINLRVAFEDVFGAKELEDGELDRGITITKSELRRKDSVYRARLLTNLCGAYVVRRSFAKARETCAKAVDGSGSPAAYNNRGVLRTLTGDLDGARRDFARVRPDDFDVYFDRLMRRDARYMATENLTLLDEVEERIALANEGRERLALDIPIEKL